MSKKTQTNRPTVVVRPDSSSASTFVAEAIAATIRSSPQCVLGLATGGTPIESYRKLIELHQQDSLDFSALTTFNLDEYVGLAADHPQSYRCFMQHHLFDHVNVDPSHTHLPDGLADDLQRHASQYDLRISEAGGIDLQLLGIGHNGHIAFNEPGSAIDSRTRIVKLTDQTIEKNARFFDSAADVPRSAITMGIGTILEAKHILMLATGEEKAEAVERAIEGTADPAHPASLLQTHPRVTFVLDREAACRLG